ncbi:MAG: hypothetical protein ACREXT_00375, partial [Gammaproteobacteria bacterium]
MFRMGFAVMALIATVLTVVMTAANADSPAGMKLYVLNSGPLKLGKGILQNFAPMEPKIQIPVGMFLIQHPKGNVLFDTG